MNSQQAINLLNGLEQRLDDYCELNNEGKAAFRMAITALELFGNAEQLPSAQPTIEPRKKGKWISCENETGEGSNTYKCSACGEIQMMLDGTPKENGWKYCPHCAAKMDEDNENG